ncbi:MAG: glycosyltransferase family 4 protein [bacterium]|nr:glycosyltransferase family 4 protein [bacterium]
MNRVDDALEPPLAHGSRHSSMRIALVIERFEPGGGVEGAAWATAHALHAEGDDVHVVCRRGAAPAGPTPRLVRVSASWQPWRVLSFSRAAATSAPRGEYDAVHAFSRTRHQDVYRTGGGCHAAYMERAYGAVGASWRRFTPRHATILRIEGAVFRDTSQWVQCNSDMVRSEILDRYPVDPERIVVIPNGVDLERFRPHTDPTERDALRQELDSADRLVWLLVGHGHRRKGIDTAIRALAGLPEQTSVLWIAGREQEPARALAAELGVADRVRLLGRERDPAELYAAADAFILPTRYDAFANVCLEAAASGLPVVTSGANGAAAWLGEAGLVVTNPEDVEGFSEALARLADAETRVALGGAARAKAETRSWADHVRDLHALYAKVKS